MVHSSCTSHLLVKVSIPLNLLLLMKPDDAGVAEFFALVHASVGFSEWARCEQHHKLDLSTADLLPVSSSMHTSLNSKGLHKEAYLNNKTGSGAEPKARADQDR